MYVYGGRYIFRLKRIYVYIILISAIIRILQYIVMLRSFLILISTTRDVYNTSLYYAIQYQYTYIYAHISKKRKRICKQRYKNLTRNAYNILCTLKLFSGVVCEVLPTNSLCVRSFMFALLIITCTQKAPVTMITELLTQFHIVQVLWRNVGKNLTFRLHFREFLVVSYLLTLLFSPVDFPHNLLLQQQISVKYAQYLSKFLIRRYWWLTAFVTHKRGNFKNY